MFSLLAKSTARTAITASRTTLPSAFATRFFSDASDKMKGTVKWFDAKKGFGFLTPDDGSGDIFVHHSSIHATGFRSLGDGEPVEFEIMEEPNGRLKALNVTGPDGAYVQGSPRRDDFGGGGGYNDGGY